MRWNTVWKYEDEELDLNLRKLPRTTHRSIGN